MIPARRMLLQAASLFGLPAWFRFRRRTQLTMLLYHGVRPLEDVSSPDIRGKHVPLETFRRQLRLLKRYYTVITWDEAIRHLRSKTPFPPRALVITFDDGYKNHATTAAPALEAEGLRAAFFLTTGFLDGTALWIDRFECAFRAQTDSTLTLSIGEKTHSFDLSTSKMRSTSDAALRQLLKTVTPDARDQALHDLEQRAEHTVTALPPLLQPMSWTDANKLALAGHAIGSHTVTHPILSTTQAHEENEELLASKTSLERHLKQPCASFAYPNGQPADFTTRTVATLRTLGYDAACTTVAGHVGLNDNPLTLRRFTVDDCTNDAIFLATISGLRSWLSSHQPTMTHQPQPLVTQFFHDYANTYFDRYHERNQEGHSFRARKARVLESIGKLPANAHVADIGCGPGVMLQELLEKQFRVIGTDIAPGMIEECQRRFPNTSTLELHVCAAEHIPIADASLDGLIAMGLVEYVEDDGAVLKEFARILKPGGIAIVSLPHWACPARAWDRVTKLVARPFVLLVRAFRGVKPTGVKHREYRLASYKTLAAQHGFTTEEVAFYNMKVLFRPLDRLFPRLTCRLSESLERFTKTPILRRLGTGFNITLRKK